MVVRNLLLQGDSGGASSIICIVTDSFLSSWHTNYIAVTVSGTTHNEVIISESSTSITLRRAEAKENSLLRADVKMLRDTGRSLMPEGLEKRIDLQGMADLIAWLMDRFIQRISVDFSLDY